MPLENVQLENREEVKANEEPLMARRTQPRAVGAPLPRGGSRRPAHIAEPASAANAMAAPTRALSGPAAPAEPADHSSNGHPSDAQASNVQRAAHALRSVVPFVQRLLPLLDGNLVTAVSNVLTPQPKPVPPVNLAPLQQGVADLQTQQRQLRDQVADQQSSLRRVEDHLELVREATDRNTLEQQELLEDLKAVGHKVNIVAFVALGLLVVSVVLNLFLFMHMKSLP